MPYSVLARGLNYSELTEEPIDIERWSIDEILSEANKLLPDIDSELERYWNNQLELPHSPTDNYECTATATNYLRTAGCGWNRDFDLTIGTTLEPERFTAPLFDQPKPREFTVRTPPRETSDRSEPPVGQVRRERPRQETKDEVKDFHNEPKRVKYEVTKE